MRIYEDSVLAGMALRGVKFIPQTEPEKNIAELKSFLGQAKKQVTIIAGGLESSVYERPATISNIETLLKKNVIFRVILGPQKKEKFIEEHPNLINLYKIYKKQIFIYIADKIPQAHFAVVDNEHVLYEENHEPSKPRDVFYEYKNKELAKQLNTIVDEIIEQV